MDAIYMRNIAIALSGVTGDSWSIIQTSETEDTRISFGLHCEDGREIHAYTQWNHEDRCNWSGVYPRRPDGAMPYLDRNDTRCDSISTSLMRSPEAIAKDITRRLLPGYTARWHEVLETNQKCAQGLKRQIDILAILVAAGAQGPRETPRNASEFRARIPYRQDGPYGTIEITSDGRCNATLHTLTPEQAIELVKRFSHRDREHEIEGH